MPQFKRYIGIDYSGAETADSSCKGIRVYMAEGTGTPDTGSAAAQPTPVLDSPWSRRMALQ